MLVSLVQIGNSNSAFENTWQQHRVRVQSLYYASVFCDSALVHWRLPLLMLLFPSLILPHFLFSVQPVKSPKAQVYPLHFFDWKQQCSLFFWTASDLLHSCPQHKAYFAVSGPTHSMDIQKMEKTSGVAQWALVFRPGLYETLCSHSR